MCPDCKARAELVRQAFLDAKIKEAASHALKGAAELVGLKKKTGVADKSERDVKPSR